jgi:hypothetical protein
MKTTNATAVSQLPLRVGVFDTIEQGDAVVSELLGLGFTVGQITVVCSEASIQRHFAAFEHEDPSGTHTPKAALTGGILGATLGGLAAVAGVAATGGVSLLAAGGLALWTGGVVGSLVGAMMTRGVEKEAADYYDQSVARGKILVAAEQKGPGKAGMLAEAEKVFERHGAHPMPMPEQ